MKSIVIVVFCIVFGKTCFAQKDSVIAKKDTFNRKKEIVFDGKRYRIYNDWLSVGAGANYNTRWPKDERSTSVDFSFHIKQYYWRIGGFMSGRDYTAANNYSFHMGYGLRKEGLRYNISAFAGPSLSYFRRPLSDSTNYDLGTVYNELGGYAVLEAVFKFKYDVGLGGQIFCDYNRVQMVYGVRLLAYFSGAYRGIKPGYHAPGKKK